MKLISLNIEGKKHWSRINPFFEAERPDVVCLQEIFENDAKTFADRFSMEHVFAPMSFYEGEKAGVALFSRSLMKNIRSKTYHSELNELQDYDNATIDLMRRTERNVVTMADIDHEGITFTVATTHFAWTPNGMMTGYQQEDAQALLKILAAIPELTLCGDFNAPRGFNGVYDLFAAQYEDAIPRSYVSSLDPAYHRAYNDPVAVKDVSQFMVDYLFLSKKYAARDVRLQSGVSDHCAVVATIVPRIMNS